MFEEIHVTRAEVLKAITLVVATALMCSVLAFAFLMLGKTKYSSESRVLYTGETSALLTNLNASTDVNAQTRQLATQAEVVTGDAVLSRVSKSLGTSVPTLRKRVSVETSGDSNVVTITATAGSASRAFEVATSLTKAYVTYVRSQSATSLERQADSLSRGVTRLRAETGASQANDTSFDSALADLVTQQAQLRAAARSTTGGVSVIETPALPTGPSSVAPRTGAVLGGGVGVIFGLGALLLTTSLRRFNTGPQDR